MHIYRNDIDKVKWSIGTCKQTNKRANKTKINYILLLLQSIEIYTKFCVYGQINE